VTQQSDTRDRARGLPLVALVHPAAGRALALEQAVAARRRRGDGSDQATRSVLARVPVFVVRARSVSRLGTGIRARATPSLLPSAREHD
jgi:hypothetical protein